MDSLLEKRFSEAEKGRMYWLYLQDKYNLDASSYVLLIRQRRYPTFERTFSAIYN